MRKEPQTIDARITPLIEELVGAAVPLRQAMRELESKYIAAATRRTRGNITRAAQLLGVHRNTLHNKRRYRKDLP